MLAPRRSASFSDEPEKSAWLRSALRRMAPERSALRTTEACSFAPSRLARVMPVPFCEVITLLRCAGPVLPSTLTSSEPSRKSAPDSSASLKSVPCRWAPRKSDPRQSARSKVLPARLAAKKSTSSSFESLRSELRICTPVSLARVRTTPGRPKFSRTIRDRSPRLPPRSWRSHRRCATSVARRISISMLIVLSSQTKIRV